MHWILVLATIVGGLLAPYLHPVQVLDNIDLYKLKYLITYTMKTYLDSLMYRFLILYSLVNISKYTPALRSLAIALNGLPPPRVVLVGVGNISLSYIIIKPAIKIDEFDNKVELSILDQNTTAVLKQRIATMNSSIIIVTQGLLGQGYVRMNSTTIIILVNDTLQKIHRTTFVLRYTNTSLTTELRFAYDSIHRLAHIVYISQHGEHRIAIPIDIDYKKMIAILNRSIVVPQEYVASLVNCFNKPLTTYIRSFKIVNQTIIVLAIEIPIAIFSDKVVVEGVKKVVAYYTYLGRGLFILSKIIHEATTIELVINGKKYFIKLPTYYEECRVLGW